MKAKLSSLGYYLPPQVLSSLEVEERLRSHSPSVRISKGIIESTTGIRSRRFAEEDEYNSHLAVRAAEKALAANNTSPHEIDLLLFAAAGQDLLEPATAHIVSQMLGTQCPVFDVKNACNSFLNALEVAEALIVAGRYKKILVVTGETPSKSIKWNLKDRNDFKKSFAGYTLGDAGAAAILEASNDESGIISYKGTADSTKWENGTLPGGGSRHPRGDEYTYFQGDGAALKEAFEKMGPAFLQKFLSDQGTSKEQINHVFIHQVSVDYLQSFISALEIDPKKVTRTVDEYGNVAAATLPLGMCLVHERNELKKDDQILLVGLAGGISLEVMLMRW